jgi:hypothetical protein
MRTLTDRNRTLPRRVNKVFDVRTALHKCIYISESLLTPEFRHAQSIDRQLTGNVEKIGFASHLP